MLPNKSLGRKLPGQELFVLIYCLGTRYYRRRCRGGTVYWWHGKHCTSLYFSVSLNGFLRLLVFMVGDCMTAEVMMRGYLSQLLFYSVEMEHATQY